MSGQTFAYISCWDNLGGAPGIGIFEFDNNTGSIARKAVVREDLSCGFSLVDEKKKILYICIETEHHPDFFKGGGGRVIAFRINEKTGELTELCDTPTFCPNPCYLALDASGRYMIVTNHSANNACTKIVPGEDGEYYGRLEYDDAVVELFSVNDDGALEKICDIDRHETMVKGRYLHSHPQSVVAAPSGNFFVSCDVAENRIYSYRIDPEANKLVRAGVYQDEANSKPRYCVFHPTLPVMYVNYEGKKELQMFQYAEDGTITPVMSASGVPDDVCYPDGKGQAGLILHPSGEYIYDLMTGTASIAVFRLESDGRPKLIQYLPSKEAKLRAIGLSPDGKYLITTCIQTGGIDVYEVCDNGCIAATDSRAELKGAAFVTFMRA